MNLVSRENENVRGQVPVKGNPDQEGGLQNACLIRAKVAHEGVCGACLTGRRSVGQEHGIHDVNNTIAGANVRCDYP